MVQTKPKELRIAFPANSKQPTYVFTGDWTGFEISTVVRGIRRAYLVHNRDKRRSVSSETSINSTKETTK